MNIEGVLVAAPGFLVEAPHHAPLDRPWGAGDDTSERRRIITQNRRDDGSGGVALEGSASGERLGQHSPEAEDVATRVDRMAMCLLRRHVAGGSYEALAAGERRAGCLMGRVVVADQLGDAEVEDLGVAAVGDDDVGRLEIAMDDARRVSSAERLADVDADADDVAAGERSLGHAIRQE